MPTMHAPAPCKVCGKSIPGGNLARHQKRGKCSRPEQIPTTAVQYLRSVREVLEVCNISKDHLGDWDLGLLDKLPNFRLTQPRPSRFHTPWRLFANEKLASSLPSLESMLIDVHERHHLYHGQMFRNNEHIRFTDEESSAYLKAVVEDKQVPHRVFNIPMRGVFANGIIETFQEEAASLARGFFQDFELKEPCANITPRLSISHVHHDSLPHISTTIAKSKDMNSPVKLWILWPSTELHRLVNCYGDTMSALGQMDQGCFLVQMAGETVIAPPNSPHAVLSINSCYIYGQELHTSSAYDPSTIGVDMAGGISRADASSTRLELLKRGFSSCDFRKAHIQQFVDTWPADSVRISQRLAIREKLIDLWASDIAREGSCAWCETYGLKYGPVAGREIRLHAMAHISSKPLIS